MSTVYDDKPVLLKSVELVLADPEDIHQEAQFLLSKFTNAYPEVKSSEVRDMVAGKIISSYSYYAAFIGGASSLTGVIPGLGTVIATFGGATADAALTMKYQIEMTMALASIHGHNILLEEEKRMCMIIAGMGAISESAKKAGQSAGSKALIRLSTEYLKGATLQALKDIFKKLGIIFIRKSLEKAIPFGIGVLIGFTANKGLTSYVGHKVHGFFAVDT